MDGVLFDNGQFTLLRYPGGKSGSYAVPGSVTNILGNSFAHSLGITSIGIPIGVISIGQNTFYGCANLTNVPIPGHISNIPASTFAYCTSLSSISIPNSIKSIDYTAFEGDSSLSYILIPTSVTNLGQYAFTLCDQLTSVFFMGNAPSADSTVFSFDPKATVYYLAGTTGWGATFGGVPAVLWNPFIQTRDSTFGFSNGQFRFKILGAPDIPIVIDVCTNLANAVWLPLQHLTLTNGFYYFNEPAALNSHSRYYRVSPQ